VQVGLADHHAPVAAEIANQRRIFCLWFGRQQPSAPGGGRAPHVDQVLDRDHLAFTVLIGHRDEEVEVLELFRAGARVQNSHRPIIPGGQ